MTLIVMPTAFAAPLSPALAVSPPVERASLSLSVSVNNTTEASDHIKDAALPDEAGNAPPMELQRVLTSPVKIAVDPALAADYAGWLGRFETDYATLSRHPSDARHAFAHSVMEGSLAMRKLEALQQAHQLTGASGQVFSMGAVVAGLLETTLCAGSAGVHPGDAFSTVLSPDQDYEGVYFWFKDESDARDTQRFLLQSWNLDGLVVPTVGTVQRGVFPLLIFQRVHGRLYLAAFTQEFAMIVDHIRQLQMM